MATQPTPIGNSPFPGETYGWLRGCEPGTAFVRGKIEGVLDIEAIEQLPPPAVLSGRTVYECLLAAARLDPQKPAITALAGGGSIAVSTSLTYEAYAAQVTAAANVFRAGAQGRPCITALMLPILPEMLVGAWGAATAGIASPINPHLEPLLVASILNALQATVLVTTRAYGPSAADHLDLIASRVPSLRRVLWVGGDDPDKEFSVALQRQRSDRLHFDPVVHFDADAMFLPTGGTTATPKLARLTQGGMVLSAWIAGAVMGSAQDEIVGIGMPLFHVGGMLMLGLRAAVLGQTALLFSPSGFRDRGVLRAFWDIAREHGMTSLIATPTTAAALLAEPGDSHQGHRIRTFTSGGSTVPLELGRAFPRRFGIEIREVWGSTEYHGFLACQPNRIVPRIGAVGLRIPWHHVKAVELDDNNRFRREMPAGEQGVIIGTGPCLAQGYVDPALDQQFFVSQMPGAAVWGSSGDLGRVDAEGYVWIDGRAKDVIIRGGHNIDPALIEEALTALPGVLYAAAVGYPDSEKGELPVAFVEAVPGALLDTAQLVAHCRATIAERAACPIEIFLVDRMPLTAVGKIFKPTLRELALRKAVTAALKRVAGAESARFDTRLSGGRPAIIIYLTDLESGLQRSLETAFSGFGFQTEFALARSSVRTDTRGPTAF